jgi:hypothetical protein
VAGRGEKTIIQSGVRVPRILGYSEDCSFRLGGGGTGHGRSFLVGWLMIGYMILGELFLEKIKSIQFMGVSFSIFNKYRHGEKTPRQG